MELAQAHPSKQGSCTLYEVQEMYHWMLGRSAVQALGYALRAVIVRLSCKGHSEHKSYFIKTYLADSDDRDHSESPGRSAMRDRNDGSRKWKSSTSSRPPFSTYYFTERADYRCPAVSSTATGTSLSLAATVHTLH